MSAPRIRAASYAGLAEDTGLSRSAAQTTIAWLVRRSQVGNGKNIALFDVHGAEGASRQLRCAKKQSFTFAEVGAISYEEQYGEQLLESEQ